jgi:hypothetical protein
MRFYRKENAQFSERREPKLSDRSIRGVEFDAASAKPGRPAKWHPENRYRG